ncbi:hypothetical protein [Burkholderia plantarii]|uniref:hypothetical protein n=1 Tax=Burkholderia plantarii TaxID=41899 RepID=UPI000705CF87|nr:hypothetical protein [Burkholderia plantarii]ALK31049.1 insecticidal toxin complex protein [Burkholderia plantarii]
MVHIKGLAVRTPDADDQTAVPPAGEAPETCPSPRQTSSGPLSGLSVRALPPRARQAIEATPADDSSASRLERLQQSFRSGVDRLYGLDSAREDVQEHLEDHLSPDAPYDNSDVTIDRINNRLGLSNPDLPASPLATFKPDPSAHPTDQAFHAFLTSREGERGKRFDTRGKDDRIRRACKLGVDFSAERGGTVHFLLGGIQKAMDNVVDKRNFNKHGGKDFTASELRYVYRNRERLRDSVRFYDSSLRTTDAPWESDPDQWARYRPHETTHSWPRMPNARPAPEPASETASPRSPASAQPVTPAGQPPLALDLGALSMRLSGLRWPSEATDDEGDTGSTRSESEPDN